MEFILFYFFFNEIGLYVGHQKPNIEKFFSPIVDQLYDLESGYIFGNNVYYFYLLNANFDKPARACILNTKSSIGYFGCIKCLQQGESLLFGNGQHIIYDHQKEYPLRNHNNYINDLNQCINVKTPVNGIKGICVLNKLKYFQPVESTNIDIMHTLWLGFGKLHFSYLFSHKASSDYSLKNKLNLLNIRLLNCKPPGYISQAPRYFETFLNWRAHEYMNFYLFFAIPVFKGIMKDKYYKHLLLFIISIEKLLSLKIDRSLLPGIKKMLSLFVKKIGKLYDRHFYTSNVHEIIHLVDCTIEQGPLNDTCLFEFEELNRKISRSIKGQNLVGDEFIKKWSLSLNLALEIKELNNTSGNILYDYIKNTFKIKSSNIKQNYNDKILTFGRSLNLNINELDDILEDFLLDLIRTKSEDTISEIKYYQRLYLNTIQYSLKSEISKYCNSVIKHQQSIGCIEVIICIRQQTFMICRELSHIDYDFFVKGFADFKSGFGQYQITRNIFCVEQSQFRKLQKLFCYQIDSKFYMITDLNTEHLFS